MLSTRRAVGDYTAPVCVTNPYWKEIALVGIVSGNSAFKHGV